MALTFDRPFPGDGALAGLFQPGRADVASSTLRFTSVQVDAALPQRQSRPRPDALTPGRESVSLDEAQAALNRIFARFDDVPSGGQAVTLQSIENVPMDSMILATTLLATKIMGGTANAKSKALDIMSRKQQQIRNQEVKDYREQMDRAIAQQQNAKTAALLGVVFDWIIAAVEVIVGIAKIVGGAMSGNVLIAAGGAMDLMAGLAGMVKATANTLALIDSEHAEKYREIADAAGKVQLSFEIAGAVVDVTSAARNMLLAKVIPKVAGKIMQEGAEQVMSAAIKEGSKDAAKGLAASIGKEVADQVSEQLLQNLGKAALEASKKAGREAVDKATRQFGVNRMLESFSREAIERMVTRSVQKIACNAIDKGVEMTASEVTKAVTRELNRKVLKEALKASTYAAVNITRGAIAGAGKITSGALALERAKLQKEIDALALDREWLQTCFAFYELQKKETVKQVRDLLDNQAEAMEDGSKVMNRTGATQAQLAASLV